MALFEVRIVPVDEVSEHPNADRLVLARIGGYTAILGKRPCGGWPVRTGELVAYIPENALVPEPILKRMGLWDEAAGRGRLGGDEGTRVRPVQLRGIYSEGLVLPLEADLRLPGDGLGPAVAVGNDVADRLGIVKYEPEIPADLLGAVYNLGFRPIDFDVEPLEKHADALIPGEPVAFTEKLHGTMTGISLCFGLDHPDAFPCPWGSRDLVVWSKGLGAQGLAFQLDRDRMELADGESPNVYVRAAEALLAAPRFWAWATAAADTARKAGGGAIHLLGETVGVQDLKYGFAGDRPGFLLFDAAFGEVSASGTTRSGFWASDAEMRALAAAIGVEAVPALYQGPWDPAVLPACRDGKTTLGLPPGAKTHIREGLVIRRLCREPILGRLLLKAVSPAYKLRKGGTEYT